MALCLPTLKLFKQKHNPFKTLQPCARSSSSCTSSSFLTSLFSLRLKPLFVFICLYLFLFVFICLYLSLFVFICLYFSLFVFYLSLFVFICLYLSLFVFICLYLSLFVFICLYLSLFVFICLYLFLFVFICLYLSLFVFNLSLFVFICQNLPILSNKPCTSNPCCSGSVQTANDYIKAYRQTTAPQLCEFFKPSCPNPLQSLSQHPFVPRKTALLSISYVYIQPHYNEKLESWLYSAK